MSGPSVESRTNTAIPNTMKQACVMHTHDQLSPYQHACAWARAKKEEEGFYFKLLDTNTSLVINSNSNH